MQTSKENKNKNVFCKCWQCCIKMYWLVWQAKIFTKVLTECKWGNNSCAEMLTSGDLKSGGSLFCISPLHLQDINDQLPLIKTNWLSPLFITSVWLGTLYKVLHEVQTIKICLAQKHSKVDFIREIWWPVPLGGGGTPLYKPCRYVPPQWVGFLRLFGLKTGIDFAHFGLELGMVFKGTAGVYDCIYCFNSKWVRKKEKWMWRIFFAL